MNPDDLPVPLSDIAKAAWAELLNQLTNVLKRVVKLWVTRDPTLTGKLFVFTAMGIVFLAGATFLGPRNPLEFGRDSLFSTVMGVTPQWVLNREQGPVQATFLSSAAACVAAIAKIRLGNNMIPLSPFMHGVLGLPVGFMLVFRWNNAYERWWSGRTELGLLLMHAKNLGGQFCTWVAPDDQQLATRALALICALKECVADRLNGTVLKDGTVMLNATSLSTPLHPLDLEGLFAAENKVLFCIENLRQCIYNASKQGCLPPRFGRHDQRGLVRHNGGVWGVREGGEPAPAGVHHHALEVHADGVRLYAAVYFGARGWRARGGANHGVTIVSPVRHGSSGGADRTAVRQPTLSLACQRADYQ